MIPVKTPNVKINNEHWEQTYANNLGLLHSLPQVRGGVVSQENAQEWLKKASQLYNDKAIARLLSQSSGFGAHEIRALIAYDNNEYHPKLCATEVFSLKRLESIKSLNSQQFETDKFLTNIARAYLIGKYDLNRDTIFEKKMSHPDPNSKAPWLIGQPGIIAKERDGVSIYDFEFTDNTETISHEDQIRLHYYDLVANNRAGGTTQNLHLVKIHIDEQLRNSLVTLAKLSSNSEKSIYQIGKDLAALDKKLFKAEIHTIPKSESLYQEILRAGQKNWSLLQKGLRPKLKLDPPMALSDDQAKRYTEAAKNFLAATRVELLAKQNSEMKLSDFIDVASKMELTENREAPFLGVSVRKVDMFDKASAAKYLTEHFNVHESNLKTTKYNVDQLLSMCQKLGGNIEECKELGAYDKKKIESTADLLGVNLSDFYSRKMVPLDSRKTRGPIFDAIQNLDNSIQPQLTSIQENVLRSELIDVKELYPSNPHQQAKLKF